jgi:hypothetical protein
VTIHPTIAPIPEDLPVVRLYLNDIDTIVQILLQAEQENRKTASEREWDSPVQTTFILGRYSGKAQTTCDEIADLPRLARESNDFVIFVSRDYGFNATVTVNKYLTKLQTTSSMTYDERVSLFHRIEHIFNLKKRHGPNFMRSTFRKMPTWLLFLVSLAWAQPILFAGDSLAKVIPKFWAFALATSVCATPWVIVLYGQSRGSTVIFRDSSAQQRIEDEKKKHFMAEIVKAVLYILVGIIVAVSAALILHKFWPAVKP